LPAKKSKIEKLGVYNLQNRFIRFSYEQLTLTALADREIA
jgi:hypothetical protein